jgi:hypothetical protein
MMKKHFWALAAAVAIVAVGAVASVAAAAGPASIYDAIPSPLPPNVPSLGYQATQTSEFGDNVAFAGTNRRAMSVTVTMSDWAKHSTYPSMSATGWSHPITINLYKVDHSGPNPAVGTLIATKTQTFAIPWRPETDAACAGDDGYQVASVCYHGIAFNITFDLSSMNVTLPNEIIYGIAYNTNTWGYAPIGLPGPYESLNVGLRDYTEFGPPSVGTDVEPDALFWNTATAANYTDGGTGGVGIFRRDTAWTPFTPAVRFVAGLPVALNKDQCKDGGWQNLSRQDGSTFKNQGDCIQYVNTGK